MHNKAQYIRLIFIGRVNHAMILPPYMSTQHITTLLGPTCCARLVLLLCSVATCWVLLVQIWPSSNLSQQHLTCRNMVAKRTHHVPHMLRYIALTCCDRLVGTLQQQQWKTYSNSVIIVARVKTSSFTSNILPKNTAYFVEMQLSLW